MALIGEQAMESNDAWRRERQLSSRSRFHHAGSAVGRAAGPQLSLILLRHMGNKP
jgi:hypothetical protein